MLALFLLCWSFILLFSRKINILISAFPFSNLTVNTFCRSTTLSQYSPLTLTPVTLRITLTSPSCLTPSRITLPLLPSSTLTTRCLSTLSTPPTPSPLPTTRCRRLLSLRFRRRRAQALILTRLPTRPTSCSASHFSPPALWCFSSLKGPGRSEFTFSM